MVFGTQVSGRVEFVGVSKGGEEVVIDALEVSTTDVVALDVGEGAETLDAAVSVGMAIGEATTLDAVVLAGAGVSDDEAPAPTF